MNQQLNHIIEENYNFRLHSFSFPPALVQNYLLWHQWLGHGQKHNMSFCLLREQHKSRFRFIISVGLSFKLSWPITDADWVYEVLISMRIILLSHWVVDLTWHIMTSWKSPLLNNALTRVFILIQAEWEKEHWFDCVEDSVKLMERSWHAMFW